MANIDKGYILTIDDNDYIIIDSIIEKNKKYLLLKGIDKEENLLDTQLIVHLVKDKDGDFAIEDINDKVLMEILRNKFANNLRKEYK